MKTKPRKLTARQAAAEVLTQLQANADAERAASYQRFFKEPVDYFGLGTEASRRLRLDLLARVAGSWTLRDAVSFCRLMIRDPHMESRGIGYQVVANFVDEASPALLADIHRWLERFCGNWGLVDNLAPSVLAPLLERHPDLIADVVSWTDSPSQWVRRGAVVAFVPLVGKEKRYRTVAYRIAVRLFSDQEDLMHKAVGWLLREAGKPDMERLERFLLKHGPRIPRTTVRYAIERFSKDDRRRLLAATRAAGAKKTRNR